jgi:hypothetical protein
MKIHPVGAKLFHVNGEMDRHDKANRCFAKVPKNIKISEQK